MPALIICSSISTEEEAGPNVQMIFVLPNNFFDALMLALSLASVCFLRSRWQVSSHEQYITRMGKMTAENLMYVLHLVRRKQHQAMHRVCFNNRNAQRHRMILAVEKKLCLVFVVFVQYLAGISRRDH